MKKEKIEARSVAAAPTVIAGALVDGKPNYITLGSYGGLSINPPIVYISINKSHYTGPGVKENGWFSVNIPSTDQVKETDYVGIRSGDEVDKSKVFKAFYGSVRKAPMIDECPVNMLCRLIHTVNLPNNEVFIGEVVETYVGKDFMTKGAPDIQKINPLLLGGGKYLGLGEVVGTPREDGKALDNPE